MGFSPHKIPRTRAYMISEKVIRFRHPDYDPDRAQKLISSSMSWHLSTRNISSKSMHAFLSNLANRQTDRQTDKHGQKHYLSLPLSKVNKSEILHTPAGHGEWMPNFTFTNVGMWVYGTKTDHIWKFAHKFTPTTNRLHHFKQNLQHLCAYIITYTYLIWSFCRTD